MSKFATVMYHMQRMCRHYEVCDDCPLNKHRYDGRSACRCTGTMENVSRAILEDIDVIIMDWATEHPEPKYPAWLEYLTSSGVIPGKIPPSELMSLTFTSLQNTEIPADIAEKLGIKPIEGGK